MSEPPPGREFEYCLLRYVPNVLTGEFVNVGLVMWKLDGGSGDTSEVRVRQDWDRVSQVDPDADTEILAALCSEISTAVRNAPDAGTVRRKLESSLSNALQLSDPSPVLCTDPEREMDKLAAMYLGSGKSSSRASVSRVLELVPGYRERAPLSLPLWGMVAAGRPIEAVQSPETISLEDVVGSKTVFVLKVRGDSMQDEHIVNGDYVLLEKTKKASNGDIVVALVDGNDATLKRFYLQGGMVRLQPSNAAMPPIVVSAAAVQIQGKVIGVLRKY